MQAAQFIKHQCPQRLPLGLGHVPGQAGSDGLLHQPHGVRARLGDDGMHRVLDELAA